MEIHCFLDLTEVSSYQMSVPTASTGVPFGQVHATLQHSFAVHEALSHSILAGDGFDDNDVEQSNTTPAVLTAESAHVLSAGDLVSQLVPE